MEDYLALGHVPEPRTIFKAASSWIRAIVCAASRPAPPAPREYWDLSSASRTPCPRRMPAPSGGAPEGSGAPASDLGCPPGGLLSGGVDSSAVVATMAGSPSTPVNTCSIGFDDPAFNEAAFAAQVAERYQTRHHVEQVASDDFDLIDDVGPPLRRALCRQLRHSDLSGLPVARKRVTVALSGDGGDEALAGYRRYRLHMTEERGRVVAPGCAGRCSAARAALSQGRLGPAHVSRQDHLRMSGSGPGDGRSDRLGAARLARQARYSDEFRAQLAVYSADPVFRRCRPGGSLTRWSCSSTWT